MDINGTTDFKIRKADKNDLRALVDVRLAYLDEDWKGLPADQRFIIKTQLNAYFKKHLGSDDFTAMLAEQDGETVSSAFIIYSERPANLPFITGKTALILNVFTAPAHRGKGLATKLLGELIREARERGASFIELSATPAGRPLYEKLGFTLYQSSHCTEMRLQLA